jgi:tRNA(adenine34) deaminase
MIMFDDEYFMREALKEADKALKKDEVPIGAIIVHKNKIIARAHNLTETLNDVTAHAEMQAFTSAANTIGGKYLTDCTLYVTLEPCMMCASAAFWTQISTIVYGASDPKRGYISVMQKSGMKNGSVNRLILHPKTIVKSGILEQECASILKDFFKKKR